MFTKITVYLVHGFFERFARFWDDRENAKDNEPLSRLKTIATEDLVEKTLQILAVYSNVTVSMLGKKCNVSKFIFHNILGSNVNKQKISSQFLPYSLTENQRTARVKHVKIVQKN